MSNPPNPDMGPRFRAISSHEHGWWHGLAYDAPGAEVSFENVNGVSIEHVLDTPTYGIDASIDGEQSEGVYLVASGCLVNVEGLARQLEQAREAGRGDPPMVDLVEAGSVIPLTEGAMFRLPPQKVDDHITILYGDRLTDLAGSNKIRRIELDLLPYDVFSPEDIIRFAGQQGLKTLGLGEDEVGAPIIKGGFLGDSPLTRAAKRLNYALVPVEDQERMRKPLDKTEVLGELETYIAGKLQESPPGS